MPQERRQRIIELLYKKDSKSVTVKYLCDHFGASEATIRRDLTSLEEEGKLERTHGGAMLNSNLPLDHEETFSEKESAHSIEKKMIARKAFDLLKNGDSVFLDGGTTTLELAKMIGRSRLKIQVFSNAPDFARFLAENPHVDHYLVGGKVRNNTLAAVGQLAIDTIRRFRIQKVFLGVNAISYEYGFTTPDYEEAEVKRAILQGGRERIVLADGSKFDKVALCEISPIGAVDRLITSNIEPDMASQIEALGVQIIQTNIEGV